VLVFQNIGLVFSRPY